VVFNNASPAIYTDGAMATGLKHDRLPFRPRRDLQVPLSIGIDTFKNSRGRCSPFQELLHCGEMRLGLRPSSSVAWSRSCVTEIPMCRSVGQIVEGVAAFLQKAMALPKSLGCRSGNAMAGNTPWRPFQNCLWRQARKATRSRAPGNDASGRQQRPAGV
jgi:hypothetical protein